MSHPLAGRKQSPEHIAKRVEAKRRLGTTERMREAGRRTALRNTGKRHTDEHKAKISAAMKGKQNALGFKRSEAYRRRLSEYWAANREKHNHFKDGKGNSEREQFMQRLEYRLWRESVFKRDNWTCQRCGQVGRKLHADHIKPYSLFPELRLDEANGRTLCQSCHLSRRKWDEEYAAYGLGAHTSTRKVAA